MRGKLEVLCNENDYMYVSLPGWLPIFYLSIPKTECLLIGLKKQLDKIHNSSLNTTHSTRNLVFIFDGADNTTEENSGIFSLIRMC